MINLDMQNLKVTAKRLIRVDLFSGEKYLTTMHVGHYENGLVHVFFGSGGVRGELVDVDEKYFCRGERGKK